MADSTHSPRLNNTSTSSGEADLRKRNLASEDNGNGKGQPERRTARLTSAAIHPVLLTAALFPPALASQPRAPADDGSELSAFKRDLKQARKNTTLIRAPITTITVFIVSPEHARCGLERKCARRK